MFRRNATFAVWDERGLTIRVGKKVKSTELPDLALSPKAFTREEILQTQAEIKKGRRSRDVAGLSGAIRVGNRVYFLGRWEDTAGKAWAEALFSVDLTESFPEPKFLARVHALSLADKPIDNQMFILDGQITYIARTEARWGIEQFNPQSGRFIFDEIGDKLDSYLPIPAQGDGAPSRIGLFVEKTAYGTTVAGRVDLHNRFRKTLAEARAKMRFVDTSSPECVVLSFGNAAALVNTGTGAVLDLPVPSSVRRTPRGMVIWTPVADPKRAWLFDPVRWQPRANWPSDASVDRP